MSKNAQAFSGIASSATTHQVSNQVPPLKDTNLLDSDPVLVDALNRYHTAWMRPNLERFGQKMGSAFMLEQADLANRHLPVLKTHDRLGNRIDEVEFHPSWHKLMSTSIAAGMHNLPWVHKLPGAHTARAAMMYMAYQTEAGHCCPVSMTYAAYPVLEKAPDLAAHWQTRIQSNHFDGRLEIGSKDKRGAIFGMGMTEKQGGSDVRANTTFARLLGHADLGAAKLFAITGHKWFCSAPMSDAFLVLAQSEKGLSCFLVPRVMPDGKRNVFQIQRLKDKLGNKSNASSEVEFRDTLAYLVGEEGRGVATIIEMVTHTRLDCAIGSASLMRQSVVQAVHHTRHRSTFGKLLIDQPMMKNVLADLALESEAAALLVMRQANSFDLASNNPSEESFRRITSAIAKYWLCKRAPTHVVEGLECHGGNGYVEEHVMPRLFRESPLNSIWEGSGNIMCLDVMRAIAKEAGAIDTLEAELAKSRTYNAVYDTAATTVIGKLHMLKAAAMAGRDDAQIMARRVVEELALALQASLMIRYSAPIAADAFIHSRLSKSHGYTYGTLALGTKFDDIIGRYVP
jgi:putative acyl-CoA dehydrogenase